MNILFLFLVGLIHGVISSAVVDDDIGFEAWFTTNRKEFENHQIYFDKPLPTWLKGTLIRNGPAQYETTKRSFTNALDGFAKLSAWRFNGSGFAYFTTKFIQSEVFKTANATENIAAYLTFAAVDPPFNEMEIVLAIRRQIDNMNVNVYNFSNSAGYLYALSDAWKIYEFDPHLNTKLSTNPTIPQSPGVEFVNSMSCAHPLPEYGTDYHLTFYTSLDLIPGTRNRQSLVRVKSPTEREVVAQWETDQVSYIHSFSVTQNYVIFFNAPYFVRVGKLLKTGTVVDSLEWHADKNGTAYIVHIPTGNVISFEIDNSMVLHHINAYENPNDNTLIVDVCSHRDPFFSNVFTMATILNPVKRNIPQYITIKRYTFDLIKRKSYISTFKSSQDAPCSTRFDIPTINENYRSRKYCFAYGISYNCDGKGFAHIAIIKKDMCDQNRDKMLYIPNHYPTEVWFVPTPTGIDEDDGILFTSFLNGEKKQSYLAIIDAKTMNITHKSVLPTVVPFNFHGRFFSNVY